MPRSAPFNTPWLVALIGLALAGTAGAENPVALDDIVADGGAGATHRAYLELVSGGYQPLSPIDGMDHLDYDFSSRLFQLPVYNQAARPLTLVVQSADFEPHFLRIETRAMENLGMNAVASNRIEELGDGQAYRVRLEGETPDDRVLLADLGWLNNGTYGVALSDPAEAIAEAYAPGTDHNPVSAEYTLGLFANREGAPQAIRELRDHWQGEINRQRATEYYGYIEESWQIYEEADAVEDRLQALQEVQSMAETYLADFPDGAERGDVQAKLETASERLDAL